LAADRPDSIEATRALLLGADYVAGIELATCVFLALRLERPLFIEGEPGTGKTELARTLAQALGAELIRLQCYDGLDVSAAAYEWNHARQLLAIRAGEAGAEGGASTANLYDERYLIARPLLRALLPHAVPPVLLIDELDRSDEPFEAYLLELLADYQISIPELGTIKAAAPPVVVITSNRTREVHDAVKRRCLYHWVGYPDAARELEILRRRAPQAPAQLSRQIVGFVQGLRQMELYKLPGIAETIEWTRALMALDAASLEPQTIEATLGLLLKYQDDIARVRGPEAARLAAAARQPLASDAPS
jgi:MoxR-like ATPase